MRRRFLRQATLILVVWPSLILIPPLSGDKSLVPLWGMVLCTGVPVLLPLNIWAAVSARKAYNTLSTHSWRLVECEVVQVSSHGWPLRGFGEQSQGREVRAQAVLRINGLVVTATPFKRYVDVRLGQLWCAGDPRGRAVASEPGGRRPFRIVRYKGRLPAEEARGK